jgi:hypothetical protein
MHGAVLKRHEHCHILKSFPPLTVPLSEFVSETCESCGEARKFGGVVVNRSANQFIKHDIADDSKNSVHWKQLDLLQQRPVDTCQGRI